MTGRSHLPMGEGQEFDAIRRLLSVWGSHAEDIGDDAAVLDIPAGERLVVSTDASVEHVHFRREWLTAPEIGARATAAALSDLAAMGAVPRGLLVALALPEAWRADLEAIAAGVGEAAAAAGCPIVGGNITASDALSLTITVLGSSVHPVRRSGAVPGDSVVVTGVLGGPGAALRALLAGEVPRVDHRDRFARPVPRLVEARWLAEHGARAAIDISDGLLADAEHLARASGVSIEIDSALLPCVRGVQANAAATSGEEYELLVCVPPDMCALAGEFESHFGVRLTCIGKVCTAGAEPVRMLGMAPGGPRGHDHLRQ